MGNQTVSDESGEDDSGDENTTFESEEEEVEEEEEEEEEEPIEEEPSEEEPNEEDPDEEDPDEIQSGEEPAEDSKDDNLHEQELDEVASCEVEPDEENSCEEDSCEEEPNDNVCEGVQNVEEDQMEEPCEQISDEEEPCEEQEQENCEEQPDQESCEEQPVEEGEEEPCEAEEEPNEEPTEEEPVEEPCEEDPNDEPSEEEPFKDEEEPMEEEEDPDDDPDDENNEGSDTAAAPKRVSELSVIQSLSSNVNSIEELGSTGITGIKRSSRWDEKGDTSDLAEDDGKIDTKKKKTRWSRWSSEDSKSNMESPLKPPGLIADMEYPNLLAQLFEITKKMQSGAVDDRPESERSPSPPPIINDPGIKIDTREDSFRAKLVMQRQKIISELIEKNPNFKPPPYIPFKESPSKKTNKLQKKLYVPCKEYPEYNFVGLIMGPCGNTQKRMQKETGAKILLRGKGSMMNPKKPDTSDTEDLHVLIEADDKYSLDAAAAMVEKLLVPVDDGHNVHKLSQLRELAELKGNLREYNTGNFNKHDPCNTCGKASHPTSACPLTAPTPGTNSNAQQVNFLAEIRGALAPFSGPALSSSLGNSTSSHISQQKKEIDDSVLYVGFLPQSVDDNKLCQLFSPFGLLLEAKVIKDKNTGLSKGYGFVKYRDHVNAATAVSQMNRYKIDGKMLSVRIKGIMNNSNNTGSSGLNKLPTYQDPAIAVKSNPNPMLWPGPPESKLPETVGSVQIAGFNYNAGFSSLDKLPTYPGPALAVKNNTDPMLWPGPPESKLPERVGSVQIAGFNNNTGFSSLNKLPTYPGPAIAVKSNPDPMLWPGPPESKLPETVGSVQIAGFNNNTGFSSLNKLPTYPGPAIAVKSNPEPMLWPGPPESKLPETVGSVQIAGFNNNTGFSSLNKLPGPALAVHNNPDPRSWPGPPDSNLPKAVGSSLPYRSNFQINSSPFSRLSGTPPTSTSLFSPDFAASNDFSQFPGYLKSLDPPSNQSHGPPLNQLYHRQSPMPSSLSSSSSSSSQFSSPLYSHDYFTKKYGSYQRPPT